MERLLNASFKTLHTKKIKQKKNLFKARKSLKRFKVQHQFGTAKKIHKEYEFDYIQKLW